MDKSCRLIPLLDIPGYSFPINWVFGPPRISLNKNERKMAVPNKDKIRQIYVALPKLNCGLCGYDNCGQFAAAVAEEKASPFGCRQNPWAGYNISEIIGPRVPVFGYQQRFYQPFFAPRSEPIPSLESLRKEVGRLSRRIGDILNRIENLGRR